jgi:hypothetical protein
MARSRKFPITGLKWIPYIIGWATGVFSLLFWLIMVVANYVYNKNDPFFNNDFHRRVYYWGLVFTALIFVAIVSIVFMFSFAAWGLV